MKNYIKIMLIPVILFVTVSFNTDGTLAAGGPTMHDRIYHFQHRMLPEWAHNSEGKFFKDLIDGHLDILLTAASNVVGEAFSKNISIQISNDGNGVLLIFPEPAEPPECYFVFITKVKEGYRFFTYEKTHDLLGSGNKGVVGEWLPDGKHLNYGPRKYEDAENFVNDLKEFF